MSHNENSDSHPDSPAAGATTPLGSPPAPTRTGRPADDLAEHHAPGQDAGPPQSLHAWTHVIDAITPARIRHGITAAVLVAITVCALAYGLYWWQFHGRGCCDQAAWGQFGDFVGGVINPVVGLLTLMGLAVTVMLQVGQLALSRQALHEAQQEVRAAATERAETARLMAEQLQSARLTAEAQRVAALCALLPRLIDRENSSGENLSRAAVPSTKDALPLLAKHHVAMAGWRMKVDQELVRILGSLLPAAGPELPVADGGATSMESHQPSNQQERTQ